MKENNTYNDGFTDKKFAASLRSNPFGVPSSYFEELSANIQAHIAFEQTVPKTSGFTVPPDYFETLGTLTLSQVKVDKYRIESTSANEVPDGYFNDLTSRIMSNARLDLLKSNNSSFSTPNDYFPSLSERIKGAIFEDSLAKDIATDGFEVPPNYFEELGQRVTSRVSKIPREYKNKPVIFQLNVQGWIKYAAAACVTAIIGIASYNTVTDYDNGDMTSSHLNSIPEQEILNYLASSTESDDMLYIMEYLYQPTSSEEIGRAHV